MSDPHTVTVSIFDKDYQVACAPGEIAALRESAQYLDAKMRELKSSSNVFGLDRLAVMAALNIANDFLSESQKTNDVVANQKNEIQNLNGKLDLALRRLKSGQD